MMSLRSPNLDDRRFEDLVEEGRRHIALSCREWTDLSPGDPGIVILEVFAYLTDILLYRLNRLPEKAYIEFLRLIGVRLHPPAAAGVHLRFRLARSQNHPVDIPKGTRITTGRSDSEAESPVFVTTEKATIEAGDTEKEIFALHCDLIEAELAGVGTSLPGLFVKVNRPPIIAPSGDQLDLVVGVEAAAEELAGISEAAVEYGGKAYRIWREVDNFNNLGEDRFVYVADRLTGMIYFAPSVRMGSPEGPLQSTPQALAEIPPAEREIRVWYRRGGGPNGNVTANLLTTLKDPLPGVEVTNLKPATGGREAESVDDALQRGPQELHSLHRAVTARDFELIAKQSSGGVDRVHAFTKAMLWSHATPGTVEVLLVPHIPESQRVNEWVKAEVLKDHETEAARRQIQEALDERKPLGTTCLVNWVRYKPVRVRARVRVYREEAPAAVRKRVLQRLYRTITPLSSPPGSQGWTFGKPLTSWDIYKIIDEEPGVSSVSQVRMVVDEVPDQNVKALCADSFQPHTCYAGAGDSIFRSTNDGVGWESIGRFPGEIIVSVKSFPREASTQRRPGLLAVATQLSEPERGSALHISHDCGETWEIGLRTTFFVNELAWVEREYVPVLLLATEKGLYELAIHEGAQPFQVLVEPQRTSLGFYSVAVSTDVWGGTCVAVAARGDEGVFISDEGGKPETFRFIGLKKEMVRRLVFHHYAPHRYLWACTAAIGDDAGKGCFRWKITGAEENPEGWIPYRKGWNAGSCRDLTFQGTIAMAASLRGGVLRLDITAPEPVWTQPDINCKLPLRAVERLFQPIDAVSTDPLANYMLAGGIAGIYCSRDLAKNYEHVSSREFPERVTLPSTWLFCSAEHEIKVESEDEAGRD
jgi:hypothetical protein